MSKTKWFLVTLLMGVVIAMGGIWAWSEIADAREAAARAARNLAAARDTSRILTDSLTSLNGRHAAERLALENEIDAKDAAVKEREAQLNAETVALTKIRLERDRLRISLEREPEPREGVATFTRDTAGIKATVDIEPSPPQDTKVGLRLTFEPTDVVAAFMKDQEGQISVLAIADSVHRARLAEIPEFVPPPRRGFRVNVSLPVAATAVAGSFAVGLIIGLVN